MVSELPLSRLATPPPDTFAMLPVITQSSSAKVPSLFMPPPNRARPLLTVRPEMVIVPVLEVTLKMRNSGVPPAVLRWIVRLSDPGPEIVRSLSITSSPLVSVTVPRPAAKLIVSPGRAPAIASRNVPGPISPGSVTVIVFTAREVPDSRTTIRIKRGAMTFLKIFMFPFRVTKNLEAYLFRRRQFENGASPFFRPLEAGRGFSKEGSFRKPVLCDMIRIEVSR